MLVKDTILITLAHQLASGGLQNGRTTHLRKSTRNYNEENQKKLRHRRGPKWIKNPLLRRVPFHKHILLEIIMNRATSPKGLDVCEMTLPQGYSWELQELTCNDDNNVDPATTCLLSHISVLCITVARLKWIWRLSFIINFSRL